MRRAPAWVASSGGSQPVTIWLPDQMAQMMKAPRTAPLVLPEPPAISMTQTRKVVCSGSKASGLMKPTKWA